MRHVKKLTLSLMAFAITFASFSSQAMVLTINPGTESFPNSYPGTGSYWFNECSLNFWCGTGMSPGPDGGLIIGQTQSASGSHSGAPDGSEVSSIDMPWTFFGNTGMHFTAEPITILSITGNTMLLDFSGWRREWNGVVSDLGGDSVNFSDTGIAEVTCSLDGCVNGSDYHLRYDYHIPFGDQSGFGGVAQYLVLEGTIAAVPVPAAVWLLASGLLGLIGVTKRK